MCFANSTGWVGTFNVFPGRARHTGRERPLLQILDLHHYLILIGGFSARMAEFAPRDQPLPASTAHWDMAFLAQR